MTSTIKGYAESCVPEPKIGTVNKWRIDDQWLTVIVASHRDTDGRAMHDVLSRNGLPPPGNHLIQHQAIFSHHPSKQR